MSEPITAEVLEQDGPTVNPEEHATAAAEQAGEERDPQGAANEGEEESRRLGGWQRKIKKLERENELLREMALKPRAPETKEDPQPEAKDEKPKRPRLSAYDGTAGKTLDDYENDVEKYDEDLSRWSSRQELKSSRQQTEQQSTEAKIAQSFQAQCDKLRSEHDDFDEIAFSASVPLTKDAARAIAESEHGARIAYHLGSHPKEAERIAKLSVHTQIREIGKLEASFAKNETSAPAKDEDEQEEEKPSKPAQQTKAPAVPDPVRKPSASVDTAEPKDSDDYKTWLKKREAQLKRK